jgi:putative ABC transport system permease protein
MHLVRGVPGVIEVRRLVTGFAVWRTARGSQQAVLVVGIEPSIHARRTSAIPVLGLEQVAVDRSNTAMLEIGADPVDIELNDRSARFARRIDGFGSFMGTPYVFASHDDARRWLRLPQTTTNVLAVNFDAASRETDAARILAARLPEAEVFAASEFARRAENFWLARTGAGGGILMAALLGLMVGAAVLSQTLYAVTLEHFQEYLTLRSLGATDWMIRRVVLLQAAICAGLGWVIAAFVIAPLVGAARSFVPWVEFVWWIPAAALVAMVPIVLFASNVAIRAGLRADPAEVFRGQ